MDDSTASETLRHFACDHFAIPSPSDDSSISRKSLILRNRMIAFKRGRTLTLNESPFWVVVIVIQFIVRGTFVVMLATLAPLVLGFAWCVDAFDRLSERRRRNQTQSSWNPREEGVVESFVR